MTAAGYEMIDGCVQSHKQLSQVVTEVLQHLLCSLHVASAQLMGLSPAWMKHTMKHMKHTPAADDLPKNYTLACDKS